MQTTQLIEETRRQILSFFGTNPNNHHLIFTSGCTASLKIIGESFPWKFGPTESEQSCYYYLLENHNSVIGIREYAPHFKAIDLTDLTAIIQNRHNDNLVSNDLQRNFELRNDPHCLLALPACNNFSGQKISFELIDRIKNKYPQLKILVDVAALVGTSKFDLSKWNGKRRYF